MSSSLPIAESLAVRPEIFGVFRYFMKISPLNCQKGNPLRIFFLLFSLATFCSMIFRVYWMFYQVSGETLSFGWAERNMYAFISIESFSCLIAIYRMSSMNSLNRYEENLMTLKVLRKNPIHAIHDDYTGLRKKLFIQTFPVFIFFITASVYLVANKMVLYGTTTTSTWYFYVDAGISFLCAYVNFLLLPVHTLIHSGLTREFEVFNEELEQASKNQELTNPKIIQQFGDRQLKMFEYTNMMTHRIGNFMNYAPFAMLSALVNVTYLVFNFSNADLLYFLCLIALFITITMISSTLLYPPAFVQEAMIKTSSILMSDKYLQTSNDPLVSFNYRLMVDRSLKNRAVNNVIHVFAVSRKNIERAYFVISNLVLLFAIFHNLSS